MDFGGLGHCLVLPAGAVFLPMFYSLNDRHFHHGISCAKVSGPTGVWGPAAVANPSPAKTVKAAHTRAPHSDDSNKLLLNPSPCSAHAQYVSRGRPDQDSQGPPQDRAGDPPDAACGRRWPQPREDPAPAPAAPSRERTAAPRSPWRLRVRPALLTAPGRGTLRSSRD